jgi:hypothetical protein
VLFVDHKLTALSDAQRMVVKNVTGMLETQLRSTWEGQVRTRETQTRAMISDMIEEAFVIEQKYRQETENSAQQLADRQRRDSVHKKKESFLGLTEKVLDRLMNLLPHLSGLAVVDVASSGSDVSQWYCLTLISDLGISATHYYCQIIQLSLDHPHPVIKIGLYP